MMIYGRDVFGGKIDRLLDKSGALCKCEIDKKLKNTPADMLSSLTYHTLYLYHRQILG